VAGIAQGSPIEAAKSAFTRRAWHDAFELYAEADRAASLAPDQLRAYGESAWWCGKPDEAIRILERLYTSYLSAGDSENAALAALELSDHNGNRRAETLAAAWFARAEKLLTTPSDTKAYGTLLIGRAKAAGDSGDIEKAIATMKEALAIGERIGDRDIQALALMYQGLMRVAMGDVPGGMALVDEATMGAVSGDLGLMTSGIVYCCTISACRDISDFRRASDWTEAAHRWCERQSVTGFPGVCRVHRAEITALRGGLAKAEQEARVACDELMKFQITPIAAEGFYEIGAIRMRMGDLPAAEESFRQAHEMGRSPEPGLSLIRLAEGKAQVANASLKRALAADASRPGRARVLPAQVEAAIAAGDLATARAAADELALIAESFGTEASHASKHVALGAVRLADGDAAAADRELRKALDAWQKIDAPYEVSRVRMLIGAAARAMGDDDTARLELSSAKATFERIGARRDARLAAEALGEQPASAGDEARVTRTFLFTDIVNSTKLIGVIGDAAWADLIRWHDDTLRSVIAEHGGEEIRHQGDGLVVSFDEPGRALDCAVAIQRRLADHRRAHGFAPGVRVGVHETEATQRGLDYAGVGVHEAARVGGLAGEGEILATRRTLDSSGRSFATGEARTAELKGLSEPVEVIPIIWR
jgi:class 3 adenylate cyclase